MKTITKKSKCDCGKKATEIVHIGEEIKLMCKKCVEKNRDLRNSEYVVKCKNCGCIAGV